MSITLSVLDLQLLEIACGRYHMLIYVHFTFCTFNSIISSIESRFIFENLNFCF